MMISGPDGSGKSTIISALEKSLNNQNITVKTVWLRFNHYTAKIVNFIGRILGKSYYEKYSWGHAGYHDYQGLIGYFYVLSIYIDHIIFTYCFRARALHCENIILVDRYILDVVADLIVDTEKDNLIIKLFQPYVEKEMKEFKVYILSCDPKIVKKRRPDINDDKKYLKKVNAYEKISKYFNIPTINTSRNTPDEIVQILIKS